MVSNDMQDLSFKINTDHPCLEGHFPGNPIVPAVVTLDEVMSLIQERYKDLTLIGFSSVKFLKPVSAEQDILLNLELPIVENQTKIKFKLQHDNNVVAQGDIKFKHSSIG